MNSSEIRDKFLKFFEEKGHKIVPSSSLVPEGDSSVLFTTAGMQQFKPYYIGAKDPMADFGSKNVTSVQKSVRTSDIEEVGDERHLTFFEMLGNFSFGGYWKKEAILYAHEFVTKVMGLKIDYVTVFEGEDNVPEDKESAEIWRSIDPNIEIKKFGREDNFWGPTGEEGPCGPTTEIYVNGIEIWNIVFNEFYQNKEKSLRSLDTKGIDTGMGLERLAMVSQGVPTVFETDLFRPLINLIPEFVSEPKKRIITDHARASVFLIADGVLPSNKEKGSVLRKLIRRTLSTSREFSNDVFTIFEKVIDMYKDLYGLDRNKIFPVIEDETKKFEEIEKKVERELSQFSDKQISGKDMIKLSATAGISAEMVESLGYKINIAEYREEFKKHQEISKAGAQQKFKGGLAGHSEMEVKYHTATHLLHQALHDVLGDEVGQKGSNITPERLRFDFSFFRKMTDEEKKRVEEIVNEKIAQALPVNKAVLSKEEAEKTGARHFFNEKYGDSVSVYYIGDSLESAYSKEFCGGPHVENTSALGRFKIQKEEAVSAGVRRIKAILE